MAATIGYVNVIKRSGKDGSRFPLTEDCLIGSGLHCDIRIHLDDVATEHCLIKCQEGGKCFLMNLDKDMATKLNNKDVTENALLQHGDIISVSDRLFRWEYEELPQISSVTKPPVPLLSHNITDETGSSKRLVAVVSPQIRERHETSQSLRTWVLRRSVGNNLSSRSRQQTRTAEDRRRTSMVKIYAQDSEQSAVPDKKTPQSVNLSRRASVKSAVKKSLLKVSPHLQKSGVSTVETIASGTPLTMKSGSAADLETPGSKTPHLKNSRVSYSVTPRSRKSNLIQMGKRSHSMGTLTKTPNAKETEVSSPRRSYRIDPIEVSPSVKSTNTTQIVKFPGEQTTQFSEVQIIQDSDQSAVLDNKTPQSTNISQHKSVKISAKKSLLKVTPHPRKSGDVCPVEIICSETPHNMKSVVHGSVSDLTETPVPKTPRSKNLRVSYNVTPRSRKSNSTQIGKRSHSMVSLKTTPNTEESVAITSLRKSNRKDALEVSSSSKLGNATPDVKFLGEQTAEQSPDLFSSEQVSANREMVTLKELQKSTPALTERPKRKSAGLLLAHIRESQESLSHSRRNSTPSANANKTNTRSARASMVMPKKSKLSFTPLSQSKTPRTLKTLRAMSARAAKRRLTDVDLSEIAANKLKAETPKTPDKKKMAALLQCHKPRMLFSEVVKKTPVKKNVARLPSVPIIRRKKVPRKPKVHTPRKAPVKGINSTGHVDSPETIIIHGKQSMALKRQIQKIKNETEAQKVSQSGNVTQTKDVETSVSVKEPSREMNTRKSVSFSPAPQVVAFAASRRISTRKSLKIPNISEEKSATPNSELSLLEIQPNRKTSILKKPSLAETHGGIMEINIISSGITNAESVRSRSSVASSTPVRVSERQKGRLSLQSPSTPKMAVNVGKSSSPVSVTHQSPEVLNTSTVSQASSTFDFDAVTTPRISVDKLVSPLNTTSSKKQTNSESARRNVNISAQQIFKDLVADKVIDSSKWSDPNVNVSTSTSHSTGPEALAMSSGKKSDRRSVSFPINRMSTRKLQVKRTSGEVYAITNRTVPALENSVSVSRSKEASADVNELEQLSGTTIELPKLDRNRKSQSEGVVANVEDAKKALRSKKSLSDDVSLSNENVKQQSLSLRQRRSTINDLTDVRGVKRLFDTRNKQGSPLNDLSDVRGVKQLLKSPKEQKSPRNDLTDVRGVKKLMKTPSIQKSPQNDLTDVRGVKRLLKSPMQQQKSPQNDLTDVRGLKRLFRSTEKQASPKNDLTDLRGVRRLLQSPKPTKSPQNDLTDVRGVKRLLESPKPQKSPYNDLTDVTGVKQILGTPCQQKSPANDLTDVRGVKELFRSTRKRAFPENDLTDVRGVKQLLRSPLQQKSPHNDLRDVTGVKNLFRSPERLKTPNNDLSDVVGVSSLFNSPQEANKKLTVHKQEVTLPLNKHKENAVIATEANESALEQEASTVILGAKRRKYNPKDKETNISSENIVSVNSYPTRGKRAKKDISNTPDGADSHDIDKAKTVKEKLSQKNVLASDDVQQESHKNINPPRTRRGKVKVAAEDTSASDEKMLNSVKTNDLEQKEIVALSSIGQKLPSITNSPRTRRTRKQVVSEEVITVNLASLSESTSSPRTLRGKKVTVSKTNEDVESRSGIDTDNSIKVLETKELLVPPSALPSMDTVPSPRTRRGRKQVKNQKVEGEISQLPDELQKSKQDELTKTDQLSSSATVSPPKTRRGKKYIENKSVSTEELESDSHSNKLQPAVETQKLSQNSQTEIQSVSDSEPASLNDTDSPKIRVGRKGNITKHQRNKAITSLTEENISESKESDIPSLNPKQKRVIFADVIQVSSPDNNSSPRIRRGKKQVVSNEEREEHMSRASNRLVSEEQEKPLGTRSQRKVVIAPNLECSPQSVADQTRTRRGRKNHTADVSEELKLPLKGQSSHNDKTGETTSTEDSKQNKVSNAGAGVLIDSSTASPLKQRRGRKAGTKTESLTADTKEKTGINKTLENNVATVVSHTLDKGSVKSNTPDVPDSISSKRTLRGKKENATQSAITTGVPTDTSEIEESKGVKTKRTGRKRMVNLESDTSAVSTDKGSSKDIINDSSPPKRSQRGRIRVDKEEGKQSLISETINPDHRLTDSTSDSIENRLQDRTQRTKQTTASSVSKIICHPNEASEEKTSIRRHGVRQHKKDTSKNEESEQPQSTVETVQRSTRSKRKQVQETDEGSPKKKKKTQSDRLLDLSAEHKDASPRTTRQRRNRCT